MNRDLAFYRRQPYQRLWETRQEAGERYFLVRIKELPRVIGDGATRAEAAAHLRDAFDDFVTWRLEDSLDIPEPAGGSFWRSSAWRRRDCVAAAKGRRW